MPTNCLSQPPFLELVFPPYSHEGWPYEGHPALKDWVETIAWASNELNAPGLTIRLTLNDVSDYENPKDRQYMTRQQGRKVLAGYTRILGPLAYLGSVSLARFYADFAWPWFWTSYRRELVVSKKAELKQRAER